MKTLSTLFLLATAISAPLAAAEAHLDSVILSDGSRLMGLVVQDSDTQVVIQDHGVERTLSRSRVLKVAYNDPDAPLYEVPDGAAVPETTEASPVAVLTPTDDPALTDYCNGIAEQYRVPVYQVVSVQQRLPLDEVPVVFDLAFRAHVAPSVVLGLRLGGLSWSQVGLHFGFGNDIFYVDGGVGLIGTPYERLYRDFWSLPRSRWARVRLTDADIIDCVNLRFVHTYYHRPLIEVARVRSHGPVYRHAWRPAAVRTVLVRPSRPVTVVEHRPGLRKVVVDERRHDGKLIVGERRHDERVVVKEGRRDGKLVVKEGRHDAKVVVKERKRDEKVIAAKPPRSERGWGERSDHAKGRPDREGRAHGER